MVHAPLTDGVDHKFTTQRRPALARRDVPRSHVEALCALLHRGGARHAAADHVVYCTHGICTAHADRCRGASARLRHVVPRLLPRSAGGAGGRQSQLFRRNVRRHSDGCRRRAGASRGSRPGRGCAPLPVPQRFLPHPLGRDRERLPLACRGRPLPQFSRVQRHRGGGLLLLAARGARGRPTARRTGAAGARRARKRRGALASDASADRAALPLQHARERAPAVPHRPRRGTPHDAAPDELPRGVAPQHARVTLHARARARANDGLPQRTEDPDGGAPRLRHRRAGLAAIDRRPAHDARDPRRERRDPWAKPAARRRTHSHIGRGAVGEVVPARGGQRARPQGRVGRRRGALRISGGGCRRRSATLRDCIWPPETSAA